MKKLFAILVLVSFFITIYSCQDEDDLDFKLSDDACLVFDQNSFQAFANTSLIFPNIITPNTDEKNDYFKICNIDSFPNNTVIIYDRNNTQIAQFSPYTNNWNGGGVYGNGLYYIKVTVDSLTAVGSFISLGDDDDYYDISLSDCNCTGRELPIDDGDILLVK